jgi:hypothetical protein
MVINFQMNPNFVHELCDEFVSQQLLERNVDGICDFFITRLIFRK